MSELVVDRARGADATADDAVASAATVRARLVRHRRLNAVFFAVVLVMAAHEAEHVAQVVEKDALDNPCPDRCRGALGFVFDIEWVHVAYNHSLLLLLTAVFLAYGMWRREWRRANPRAWASFAVGVFVIQGYHVVEHTVKLEQWFENGHRSPTPGILGQHLPPPTQWNFSLIELHFVFNTVVFVCVLAAYFAFGFHRHVPRVAPPAPAVAVAVLLAVPVGIAWAARPPVVKLAAGVHQGPLVLDRAQTLVGEPGTVVRGGIVVTGDAVSVRDLTVEGGQNGIEVRDARLVRLERVSVRGARMDGINIRGSSVAIRDCDVVAAGGQTEGIDISFAMHSGSNTVTGCRVSGGEEGIVTHLANVEIVDNVVSGTTLRGIAVTEMSMGVVEDNRVTDTLGVAIFCGDYSHCEIRDNRIARTRPDLASGGRMRAGFAVVSQFGSSAEVEDNTIDASPGGMAAFVNANIVES